MENKDVNEGKRLNKYISDAGIASRREADKLIESGKVEIQRKSRKFEPENEPVKAQLGDRVYPGDTVFVDGTPLAKKEAKKVYLILNKPRGIICTENHDVEENVIDFVNYPTRVTYAGRLDRDSTGLLLLTNDGDLTNLMMRASQKHEKEYIVTTAESLTDEFLNSMGRGVTIVIDDDAHIVRDENGKKIPGKGLVVKTRPCEVKKLGDKTFSIILTQGYNRQIRRMCKALGNRAVTIERIRIMNLKLGDLPHGETRHLTDEELTELKRLVNKEDHSYQASVRTYGKVSERKDKSSRSFGEGRNGSSKSFGEGRNGSNKSFGEHKNGGGRHFGDVKGGNSYGGRKNKRTEQN